jgi:hypothetical protein
MKRIIKVNITNPNGALLDSLELEIDENETKIALIPIAKWAISPTAVGVLQLDELNKSELRDLRHKVEDTEKTKWRQT